MDDQEMRADRLARTYLSGHISRRDLLRRAGLLGGAAVAAGTLGPLLAACSPAANSTTGGNSTGAGQQASTSAAQGTPVSGGMLNAALTGNPDSLDPATAGIYTSLQVLDNIFSKLVTLDENGEFVPELAKSWTATDATTWTFDLVDNATFHNGEKFTANDVKYTFERIKNPKTASSHASAYASVKSIEVVTPTKVVFHLSQPYAPFLTNLAQSGQIVNQKAIESADPTRKPIGTGPFQFVKWVQNDHIEVKKNPTYFVSGQPYLDGVTFRFLDVNKSRVEGLQSKQLDWVDAIPLDELTALKSDSAYTYVTSALGGIPDFLALNCSRAPFNNKALRQAVAAAVDRSQILDVAYFGAGQQGVMEVPSGSKWFGGDYPYKDGPDLELAKQKMKEAGHPDGLNVTYLALPQYPELQKTGEVIKDQLAKIGIQVELQQLEVTVWFDKYAKGDYDMTSAYWSGTIDPDDFYSTQLVGGSANNYAKYSNPAVDALIAKARSSTSESTRKKLYEQIRAAIWSDAPLVFAHYETINYLMNKNVHGSTINPALQLRLGQVWKD